MIKNKNGGLTIGLVAGATAILLGGVYALKSWSALQPTEENFDAAARKILESRKILRVENGFGDLVNQPCIKIPRHPKPDASSRAKNALAWHMDFLPDTEQSDRRKKQLRQLDALSAVGLLDKSLATALIEDQEREVVRYRLTEQGWLAAAYTKDGSCFEYGKPRYQGISRFEQKAFPIADASEVYEVHARIGLDSEAGLASWARDPRVRAEFPEIDKLLHGREYTVHLVPGDAGWVEYRSKAGNKRADNANSVSPEKLAELEQKMAARVEELNALAPPTVDEVKTLLEKSHGVGEQKSPWPIPCINLPGSEKLPVDKKLFSGFPKRQYAVAIFPNKERRPGDRVARKTVPYLEKLEQLGVLKMRTESNVPGVGKDKDSVYDAYIYELSEEYKNRIHSFYTTCFPLGGNSVEFVDVQVAETDQWGRPFSSLRYKLKVLYKNPPDWLQNPTLLGGWPELRNTLEFGMACEGDFGFNREDRDKHGGIGSCWPAFDSYYSNY